MGREGQTLKRRRRSVVALGAVLAGFAMVLGPSSAAAVTPATAIASLNAQRSANGLPAGIIENPSLSSGCQAHDSYMSQNNVLDHTENPGSPGYTPAGAAAGQTSVLARGAPSWATPNDNPWETAPIHLAQVLDPSLLVTGYDESFGFSCLVTLSNPRRAAPASPQIFTYPGPGQRIYPAEIASEGPFTPGQLVGIAPGTVTGPYIFIFAFGSNVATNQVQISAASLRKKTRGKRRGHKRGRRVKLRTIDGTNSQLGPYIAPGGMLIPLSKLSRGTYQASATVVVAGHPMTKRWRFHAG